MKNRERAFLFDIDGTLSDCSARLHLIKKNPKDWDGFFKGIPNDPPIESTIEILNAVRYYSHIMLFTGRPESTRSDTVRWLARYGIHYKNLFMRGASDRRVDHIVKLGLADEINKTYDIQGIFEDRWPVIQALRGAGYFVYDVEQNRRVDTE